MNDLANEGNHIWVSSGNEAEFKSFARNPFHDDYSVENCVEMRKNGQWNDVYCKRNRNYFCELSGIEKCPTGWTSFGKSCYSISSSPASWFLGQTVCKKHGADLVEITSAAENAFLTGMKSEVNVASAWIGLIVEGNARIWVSSRYVANFTNWASGQPSDSSLLEDCIEMRDTGYWKDVDCEKKRKFICERSGSTTDDHSKPSGNCFPDPCLNGGTCIDAKDNYTCSCRPSFFGKTCEEIEPNNCSPNPCLNGGTCVDGTNYYICYCTNAFTGRNCDETCPAGWTLFDRSCYTFNINPASWTSAQTLCRNDGGNLAEITDAAENSFLVHLRNNYSDTDAWIGLRKANNKDTYTWVSSGKDPIFTYWASGQPNLAATLEGCVEIWWAGKWNDLQCGTKRPYFCERSVIVAN
ncbi:macrophage mannose receptor 1-like [Mercenaria mercenaria]|uniref:macrophage mannose receptor 1-like n=1 Tax=Mercenaria mercenaria TaxID=6596 RepID=UPI00234E6DBA|nr:macrophage mannose receptor 1-like [Mercenaria mercenaria]